MTRPMAAMTTHDNEAAPVLDDVRAEVSIRDLLAEVQLTQVYRNPAATNIEAVFTFPLPVEAVLLDLAVEVGGRRLKGTVVERSRAEIEYEDAIVDGDTPVMLEQVEPGLYTMNVGNLLAGETATVRLAYATFLRWNGDQVRFTLPTTVAPRYGAAAAAGIAPHQEPEYGLEDRRFSLQMAIRGVLHGSRIVSPTHEVSVADSQDVTVVTLPGRPAMDRDLVIEATARRPGLPSATFDRDAGGWVAMASFRPEIVDRGDGRRRCVTLVVDCSGSMARPGWHWSGSSTACVPATCSRSWRSDPPTGPCSDGRSPSRLQALNARGSSCAHSTPTSAAPRSVPRFARRTR